MGLGGEREERAGEARPVNATNALHVTLSRLWLAVLKACVSEDKGVQYVCGVLYSSKYDD